MCPTIVSAKYPDTVCSKIFIILNLYHEMQFIPLYKGRFLFTQIFCLMIQRIQSVYLLLITALMSIVLTTSYARIIPDVNQTIVFHTHSIQKHADAHNVVIIKRTIPLFALVVTTGFISLLNIFLFQKRRLQMRLCIAIAVLLAGIIVLVFYYYTGIKNDFTDSLDTTFQVPAILPVISIILSIMANRAIHHDEALVKSYNRIR